MPSASGFSGWIEMEHDDDIRGGGVAVMSEGLYKPKHRDEQGRGEQGQSSTSTRRGSGVSGPQQQGELPEVVTVEYIQSVESIQQAIKLNNTALKWIRDTHENPPGTPTVQYVALTQYHTAYQIGKLGRCKGEEYWWTGGTQPWSWLHMFKSMRPDDMNTIIGKGITDIFCKPVEESYDHKREAAAVKINRPFEKGAPVPVWDFYVRRVNGSVMRFHPNLTSNKVDIADGGRSYPMNPPDKGRGR